MQDAPSPHVRGLFRSIGEGEPAQVLERVQQDRGLLRVRDEEGRSLVLFSVYTGQTSLAWELVRLGAPEELPEAAALGDGERVKALLSREPGSAGRYTADGWTPLHLSSFFGHADVSDLLLERGAPVAAVSRNAQANEPIHAAVAGGHVAAVEVLLRHGADAGSRHCRGGQTPLHLAAEGRDLALVEALLERSPSVGALNDAGASCVDVARRHGNRPVVELLLRHGARDLMLPGAEGPAPRAPAATGVRSGERGSPPEAP